MLSKLITYSSLQFIAANKHMNFYHLQITVMHSVVSVCLSLYVCLSNFWKPSNRNFKRQSPIKLYTLTL